MMCTTNDGNCNNFGETTEVLKAEDLQKPRFLFFFLFFNFTVSGTTEDTDVYSTLYWL